MFADRVPHHLSAVAARKVLTPTARGYEETLEFDRGLGVFEPKNDGRRVRSPQFLRSARPEGLLL